MSHLPDQPHEVPFREVEHDIVDLEFPDLFWPRHIGIYRQAEYHMTEEELKEWEDDMRRKDQARAKLGGFGFRG